MHTILEKEKYTLHTITFLILFMHTFYHIYVENFLKLPASDNCMSKKPVIDIVCVSTCTNDGTLFPFT